MSTNNDDNNNPNSSTTASKSSMVACVLLETSMGDLVIDLDCDGSPRLVQNFIKLCKARYYTQNLIHTVVLPNRFLITGDATGTGTGGASIYALLEYYNKQNNNNNNNNNNKDREVHLRKSAHRFLKSTGQRRLSREECKEKGRVVALEINGVRDTVGSQFLITTAAGENKALDGYSFAASSQKDDAAANDGSSFLSLGRVVEDESNILDRMATTMYCDDNGRPYADVRIHRALIVHDPFEDPPGMLELLKHQGVVVATTTQDRTKTTTPVDDSEVVVVRSPSPERPEQEEVPVRIPMEQVLDEMNAAAGADGTSSAYDDPERERARMEELARQADRSRAVVLEMLGDLPSADITAPENVIFVCKLNSITTDEDLELIFSRFDPNVKVEIVRDYDTKQSLQYAFCEFTTKEQAAQAYFKMDNALVDDRRIKVDFSQSVAKMWDRYNQRIRQPQGGGHGHGGKRGWPQPRQQQQQHQQPRRGPPQNNTGPRPSPRYNNNDRQHFARDNQNFQKRRVDGNDNGRDNNATSDMPDRRRDNVHRSSATSSRDEGSHISRRSREEENDNNKGDHRHQRRIGGSRERFDEMRERHGNGRENRHRHGGDDEVGRHDGRDRSSRDGRGEDRAEHRHRDDERGPRRRENDEDSLDSRDRSRRREHKKDKRSKRDDEKLQDRRSKRDERKRNGHDDDDDSNGDSSRSHERRSKRRYHRNDRSSDDDDDSYRRRHKKKHKHEKAQRKEQGYRHKHRHHGHESRRHHRHDDDDADDQSDANNQIPREERNRTRDDDDDEDEDGSHQRQNSRRHHERTRDDRHDDDADYPDTSERKPRHRSPMQGGDDKQDGESHRERHGHRKNHHRQSQSSHSK